MTDASVKMTPPAVAMLELQWFSRKENGKRPIDQMFDDADEAGKGVFVSQDTSFGKGTKEYASMHSHEELAEHLMSLQGHQQLSAFPMSAQDKECCMYEVVREGWQCKLHLDIEWESEDMTASDAHRVLAKVVSELSSFLQVSCLVVGVWRLDELLSRFCFCVAPLYDCMLFSSALQTHHLLICILFAQTHPPVLISHR